MQSRPLFLIAILAVLGPSGCGGGASSIEMANVSGVITLKGKPLADADVFFVSGKYEGYGRTDAEGRYSLVRRCSRRRMQGLHHKGG